MPSSGASTRSATSNRTWSLPAPVEPWATASRPDAAGHLDHRQRLLGPLRRDAQRVDLAAEHVALDQEADEPLVHPVAGVDLVVRDGADGLGLPPDRGAIGRGGAAGVHVDRVHRPAVVGETGDAVRGVEAAGEGEGDDARLHNA